MSDDNGQSLRVVLCNAAPHDAPRIAKQLVEEGLAACVNVIPGVRSFYVWEGRLYDDMENTLLIKTTAAMLERLTARIREIHPYELPEVIGLEVVEGEGEPRYFAWVRERMSRPG